MGTLPIGIRKNWLTYFKYEEVRDTPRETRNILLIIFTLVAVVTFQAGVNPPGGVWQENKDGHLQEEQYMLQMSMLTMSSSSSILWPFLIPSLLFCYSLTSFLSILRYGLPLFPWL